MRQAAARVREAQEMAAVGREMAGDLRDEGLVGEADRWEDWSLLIEHGRTLEAESLRDLVALNAAAGWVDDRMRENVAALRRLGASWSRIGVSLGMSDEGARKRFSRPARRPSVR